MRFSWFSWSSCFSRFSLPALAAVLPLLASTPVFAAEVAGKTDTLATPLAAQSLESLSATRDRPLFSPTRRPPPPPPPPAVAEKAPPPPPPPPPDVALFGIVMDGTTARAVIRANPAAKMTNVEIGDDVGGWKVAQIEGQKLVLALDGRLATFVMFSRANANNVATSANVAPSPAPAPQATDKPPEPPQSNSTSLTPPKAHRVRQPN
jgi:general secretion pathway protein N